MAAGLAVAALLSGRPFGFFCGLLVASGFALDNVTLWQAARSRQLTIIDLASIRRRKGIDLPLDAAKFWLDITVAALFSVGMLLVGIGQWMGWVRLPIVDGTRSDPLVAFVIGVVSAVSVLRYLRFATDHLRLSADGLDLPRTRATVSWNDITEVAPVPVRGDRRIGAWISLNAGATRREHIRVDQYSIGASATFWLIDFFWRHPELREELNDGRALQRLRTGSVVEEEEERYV
ncbi:hypothetical protein GCM10009624_14210 [Gordonia sinesedis]